MTYEEAEFNQTAANTALGENTDTVRYDIYAYLPLNWVKNYDICLYPTKYDDQFAAATDSEKLAFQRVSALTQVKLTPGSSFDDFVSSFDTNATNDEELNNYLN